MTKRMRMAAEAASEKQRLRAAALIMRAARVLQPFAGRSGVGAG